MERLSTAETADRLGVKPATVYAYVSRGLLKPKRSADGRTSTFDRADVERLASRGRRAVTEGRPLAMTSALTLIEDGRYHYRGVDAVELARTRSFEAVASWLWGHSFETEARWAAPRDLVDRAVRVQRDVVADGEEVLPVDRIRLIVATASVLDPLRYDVVPDAVQDSARRLVAAMVDALPRQARGGPPAGRAASIAERLWPRLTGEQADKKRLRALDAALVLLADHELPVSTVAVRLAASTGAHIYAVVSAGLGVVDGPRHGGASLGAEALLAELATGVRPSVAIGERLRRGERIPGFGQPLYPDGDPRAAALLELTEQAVGRAALRPARAVIDTMAEAGRPPYNIDFALATLAHVTGMIRGAGELLFAISRTVGWVAHALEEYESGTNYRPRAVYTGPRP
jgi:citrate synthase